MPRNALFSFRADLAEEEALDLDSPIWKEALWAEIDRLWSGAAHFEGRAAETGLHPPRMPEVKTAEDQDPRGGAEDNRTRVASCWTSRALFLRFSCRFAELNVGEHLGPDGPIPELWEYDVVEAFLRPPGTRGYYEIEVSPLGQWLDLRVIQPRRDIDWRWRSRLELRVDLDREARRWETVIRLPYEPLLGPGPPAPPRPGQVWRANFFRIAGVEPARLFLCWRPTFTPAPDFHVPAAFGNLMFLDREAVL